MGLKVLLPCLCPLMRVWSVGHDAAHPGVWPDGLGQPSPSALLQGPSLTPNSGGPSLLRVFLACNSSADWNPVPLHETPPAGTSRTRHPSSQQLLSSGPLPPGLSRSRAPHIPALHSSQVQFQSGEWTTSQGDVLYLRGAGPHLCHPTWWEFFRSFYS